MTRCVITNIWEYLLVKEIKIGCLRLPIHYLDRAQVLIIHEG
jgi:hypothetical protein